MIADLSALEIQVIDGQRFELNRVKSSARILFIDSKGLLWIGTGNGVVRHNGYSNHCTKENPLDSVGFIGSRVHTITEDHLGGIWVGTDMGLNYLAPMEENFRRIFSDSRPVFSISRGENNILWMSQGSTLLSILPEKDSIQTDFYRWHDPNINIRKLHLTSGGKLLGIGSGCYELATGKIVTSNKAGGINVKALIPEKRFSEIFELPNGNLVLPADTAFIIMNDRGSILEERPVNTRSWNYALHMDRGGQMWIGMDRSLLRVELIHLLTR